MQRVSSLIRDDIKDIEEIVQELVGKGFWMRSNQSIEWRDLRNVMPDLKRFVRDVRAAGTTYFQNFSVMHGVHAFFDYLHAPVSSDFVALAVADRFGCLFLIAHVSA